MNNNLLTFYTECKDSKIVFIRDIKSKEIDYLFNYCKDNNIKIDITEDDIERNIININNVSYEDLGFIVEKDEEVALIITNIFKPGFKATLRIDVYTFNPSSYNDQRLTVKEFIRAYENYKKGHYILERRR